MLHIAVICHTFFLIKGNLSTFFLIKGIENKGEKNWQKPISNIKPTKPKSYNLKKES